MVASCSAYGCTNRYTPDGHITFHRYPVDDEDLLDKWMTAVNRKKFTPTRFSTLCSTHFRKEDLILKPGTSKPVLCKNAVPSIFPPPPAYYQPRRILPIVSEESAATVQKPLTGFRNVGEGELGSLANSEIEIEVDNINGEFVCSSTREVGSQTKSSSISSILVQKLEREIKILQKRIRRRNLRIRYLKQLKEELLRSS